jgi:hypothetical protein
MANKPIQSRPCIDVDRCGFKYDLPDGKALVAEKVLSALVPLKCHKIIEAATWKQNRSPGRIPEARCDNFITGT